MHLLGAAVSKNREWRTLHAAVIDKVWNYHSRNDRVLANRDQPGSGDRVQGLALGDAGSVHAVYMGRYGDRFNDRRRAATMSPAPFADHRDGWNDSDPARRRR